ncbi:MAG: ABC transporter ATP-binding protein [Candidatus Cloacimonetes bacterium]|nr:ABC transporter ATP-binding protein [Candidatus Cloacimonadota bacterium]
MKQLIIKNLSKTYPNGVQALKEINLTISSGMFGLLGPNGAGKSTLMRTLATLQNADEGTVFMGDLDILNEKEKVREILGFLPQEFDFYPKVIAYDMLSHFAVLKGISKSTERKKIVNAMLERVHLLEHKKKKLGGFSGGMKQRLGIAQALLGDPELLIVDEPTAGLDPKERHHFHNLLSEIGENRIVILSTHIVDDVSDLCSDMAIINKGELIFTKNPLEAIEDLNGNIWSKLIENHQLEEYKSKYNVISSRLYIGKRQIHIFSESDPSNGFRQIQPNLEDVYFSAIPEEQTGN